jgi:hypothetical protein
MATQTSSVRFVRKGFAREGAVALGLGSFVGVPIGVATATVAPQLATPGSAAFGWAGAVLTLAHVAVLFGVAALAASPAARPGWLKRIGFAAALAGLGAQVLGEAIIRFDMNVGNAFFTACMPLMGAGMLLAGIAVIRTGVWSGWRRFSPVACGLYVPAVLIPSFVIAGGPSFLALAGFAAVYALLGLAMFVESPASETR